MRAQPTLAHRCCLAETAGHPYYQALIADAGWWFPCFAREIPITIAGSRSFHPDAALSRLAPLTAPGPAERGP